MDNSINPQQSLNRIVNQLASRFPDYVNNNQDDWNVFRTRLTDNYNRLFNILFLLYGTNNDFFIYLEELVSLMLLNWQERSGHLKQIDISCEQNPDWFLSNQLVGGVCYVDLFAGNLQGIIDKIPYFKELGITYLHLMPPFKVPLDEHDGGYAVSSYREVNPTLGSISQLRSLIKEFQDNGIILALDFIFNHTSMDHRWAKSAASGDPLFSGYYHLFSDKTLPDQYNQTLRDIFPQERSGSFTYFPDIDRWVWTTFNSYQWDLNYRNQAVFNSMAGELLFLANLGVRVLRLDAVAFIWKELGTTCENLPQAHWIIQAYNTIARIVSPSVIYKSEAIVHPDDVISYIGTGECQISYNPLLMATLWESLATRKVELLHYSMANRFQIPEGTGWVNYIRVHDDIGWTFSDEDAAHLSINGFDHRKFLNKFYTGEFPGSFGRGLAFQYNPKNHDMRISGTCASLAGLEKAINEETEKEVEIAIKRILLLHSIVISLGGMPLIYLGDEIGTLNDYSFLSNPSKQGDSRWVHRPITNWSKAANRNHQGSIENKIFYGLQKLVEIRKANPVISSHQMEMMDTANPQILGYRKEQGSQELLVFANFSEETQPINPIVLKGFINHNELRDLITGSKFFTDQPNLAPYQFYWLVGDRIPDQEVDH